MTGSPTRFSDVERRVIVSLGEGHTAKSIAPLTGLSVNAVNAVNERLREARRKTGVGSSRELARMLRGERLAGSQETCAKEMEVAGDPGATQVAAAEPVGRSAGGPLTKGAPAMIFFALGAAAAIVTAQHPTGSASSAPRVVATRPAMNNRIAPGPYTLAVTFDRPMRAGSYSFVTTGGVAYPDCEPMPHQSDDGRTFTLRCVAHPGQRYAIGFNSDRFRNFVSRDGNVAAEPATLSFGVR